MSFSLPIYIFYNRVTFFLKGGRVNGFCGLRGDAKDLWRAGEILDNSSYFSLSYQEKYSLYMHVL